MKKVKSKKNKKKKKIIRPYRRTSSDFSYEALDKNPTFI